MSRLLAASKSLHRKVSLRSGLLSMGLRALNKVSFSTSTDFSKLNTLEKAGKLEPIDPLLLADATPEQRRDLSTIVVPAVFQQYMRRLQLSLADRIELLTRLRDKGAQSTALWMLENAPRFQAALEARQNEAKSQSVAKTAEETDTMDKLKELQQEYEYALVRHATRRKRRLEQTQQASLDDRQWLAELAEYVGSLNLAATAGSDAASVLPNWSRFVMERRSLEHFYQFVRAGRWAPLPVEVTRAHMVDILNMLRMARGDPALARDRMEQFRQMTPLHAELARRFLEPALGVMPPEQALVIAAQHEHKLPERLKAENPLPELELARMIRLGVAPAERLEALVPEVFDEEELEDIDDDGHNPIHVMLQQFTPDELAAAENFANERMALQMAVNEPLYRQLHETKAAGGDTKQLMEKWRKEPAEDAVDDENGYDEGNELDPPEFGDLMVGDPIDEFVPGHLASSTSDEFTEPDLSSLPGKLEAARRAATKEAEAELEAWANETEQASKSAEQVQEEAEEAEALQMVEQLEAEVGEIAKELAEANPEAETDAKAFAGLNQVQAEVGELKKSLKLVMDEQVRLEKGHVEMRQVDAQLRVLDETDPPNPVELAAEYLVDEAVAGLPSKPTNLAEARKREHEQRDSLLVGNLRADQVAAIRQRAEMQAAVQTVLRKPKQDAEDGDQVHVEDPLDAQKRSEAARLMDQSVLPVEKFEALLKSDPAAAARLAATTISAQPSNVLRALSTVESLLALPAKHHPLLLEAFERAKLQPEVLIPALVPESQLLPGRGAVRPEEALERALRLELRLLADIDAQRVEMRQRTPRERVRELQSLRKEAKLLGIDVNRLQLRDVDRIREAVQVVKFAHKYFPNDPLHNGILNISPTGEVRLQSEVDAEIGIKVDSLLPGIEEQAVLVLTHLLGLGFQANEARHVAQIVLNNEQPPPEPSEMDSLERAQRARLRTASLVGQALLRLQLETDSRLSTEDVDCVVAAVRHLQRESEVRMAEQARVDPLGGDLYDDEFGVRNTVLPGLRTAATLPENVQEMLDFNPVPHDFDGETDLERELERRDHWRKNKWSDIMSSLKYQHDVQEVEPMDPGVIPRQLDPEICRQVYDTYKANPSYWTPLRLSCQFHLKLERIEAILSLWYIEDCAVARGEIPSFASRQRRIINNMPDDRHFDGVEYAQEDFVESSGNFFRDRPEALFLTQEDLERFMWRRSRPFRDFARRPNLLAGQTIPSLAGHHRSNRFKFVITDTSEGRNHPAPIVTVRQPDGRYRWATEAEYSFLVDSRSVRRRRQEESTWEFEFIRRRLVQAGYHYSLLNSETCPVRRAREALASGADATSAQQAAQAAAVAL